MQESKSFCASYLTKFSIVLAGTCMLLRLVGVVSLIPIVFRPFNIKGRETYFSDFAIEKDVELFSVTYKPILFQTCFGDKDY